MTGIEMIAAERRRQVEEEGYSATHDDQHVMGDLAVVAAALAVQGTDAEISDPFGRHDDPWGLVRKHRGNRVRGLVIAGSLIAAEIDRELRAWK